jgi:CheY-like chemotaxis protein
MPRVLVIEDNPANLYLFSYLLRSEGFEVATAIDGVGGLKELENCQPDVVLCDLQMFPMSGYQVAAAMRADPRWSSLLLVAVTAFSMPGDREQVLESGFDAYFAKPIEPAAFVSGIRELILSHARDS